MYTSHIELSKKNVKKSSPVRQLYPIYHISFINCDHSSVSFSSVSLAFFPLVSLYRRSKANDYFYKGNLPGHCFSYQAT